MPDSVEALGIKLDAVSAQLLDVAEAVDINEGTVRKVKHATVGAYIGIALDIALSVWIGFGWFGISHNQDRIDQLHRALQVETERNTTAQCATVALFLQFESRTTVNPSYTDEQRIQQRQAYATLRKIGHDLQCPEQ